MKYFGNYYCVIKYSMVAAMVYPTKKEKKNGVLSENLR